VNSRGGELEVERERWRDERKSGHKRGWSTRAEVTDVSSQGVARSQSGSPGLPRQLGFVPQPCD
jgi:hypothetical protein